MEIRHLGWQLKRCHVLLHFQAAFLLSLSAFNKAIRCFVFLHIGNHFVYNLLIGNSACQYCFIYLSALFCFFKSFKREYGIHLLDDFAHFCFFGVC